MRTIVLNDEDWDAVLEALDKRSNEIWDASCDQEGVMREYTRNRHYNLERIYEEMSDQKRSEN